ncbi:hypothetical protein [Geodermatophilus sabuli]|uniref:hypothetical protein n=1 Tax=Geodermatophilus sabuli TaxID=1564158 RepID=UPI00117A2CC0|nr:hypothetical protein [Geodermatophilus sabuli]MBB3086923.1 hypothetical protein [Geodermatophilus sabuli]
MISADDDGMEAVVAVLIVWVLVSVVAAVVIGRGFRRADASGSHDPGALLTTADLPPGFAADWVTEHR